VRPVGCTAKFSETSLETAYAFNSWATALVDIPAFSMTIARIVLCDKTAHFRVLFIFRAVTEEFNSIIRHYFPVYQYNARMEIN